MMPDYRRRHILIALIAALLIAALGTSVIAQQDARQSDLIEALRSGTPEQRLAAVKAIEQIPTSGRSSSLLAALIAELDRLDEESERAYQASLARPTVPEVPEVEGDNEYVSDLLHVVCQFSDPSIIRPLIAFMGYSPLVVNTIAQFGDLAVPAVAKIAIGAAQGRRDMDASIAVLTLQRILERDVEPRRLSNVSRRTIIDIARRRLTGKQRPGVAITAIDLAIATGEPDLLARVKALAVDEASVRRLAARGESVRPSGGLIIARHLSRVLSPGFPTRPRRPKHVSRERRLRGGWGGPSRRHPLEVATRFSTHVRVD